MLFFGKFESSKIPCKYFFNHYAIQTDKDFFSRNKIRGEIKCK